MRRIRLFFVFSFLFLFVPFLFVSHTSFAKSCDKGKKLLILPIKFSKNKKTDSGNPSAIITILLKDYLSLVKGVSTEATVSGEITQSGKQYKLISHIDSASHQEIFRFEGSFDHPGNLNLMLLDYVEGASTALGKKLSKKELIPFLNISSSAVAYEKYAKGRMSLMNGNWEEAATFFEDAIKNDYNYVPAYVGLSDALAKQSSPKSEVEWKKAQLLNPVVSKKMRELSLCP